MRYLLARFFLPTINYNERRRLGRIVQKVTIIQKDVNSTAMKGSISRDILRHFTYFRDDSSSNCNWSVFVVSFYMSEVHPARKQVLEASYQVITLSVCVITIKIQF